MVVRFLMDKTALEGQGYSMKKHLPWSFFHAFRHLLGYKYIRFHSIPPKLHKIFARFQLPEI